MLEGLFIEVAGAVFSYVIEKLDPAEQIRNWLKREPSRLAFQKALLRSYTAFARQYPEYVASLFDQSFLTGKGAPELAKLLTRHLHPDPALFAQVWGTSIGFDIHSPFCKEATKPAADFLKWLEAELKSEVVFQPLFDSRALESLPNLENQIEKLTIELKRGFDVALKAAKDYERVVLEIGGDVKDSNIIVGDNNQITVSNVYNHYHTGAFVTLNDYYIPPDAVFQRVSVDEFVGRDWLTAKVDDFLDDSRNKSGIFLLVGEAGVGKTSFTAHLVKERRYLHLFAEQVPGDANLQRALQSLGSQLVTRYQIETYKDRDTLTQLAAFPDFLDKLLRLAANTLTKNERIVIVCDALDEAGTAPDGNVFGLPNVLPDNIYFILSQRPVSTKLPNVHTQTTTIEAQGGENLQDMQDYLKAVTKRPEIAGQLRSKNYSEEFFIQTLQEKSLGVWMYLHYIIEEVGKGSRAPLELESLPTGLVGYYADYWNDWRDGKNGRGEGRKQWDGLYAPLLTTLAVAQQPITIEQIMVWSGIKASEREVIRLLQESWRSFLTIRDSEYGKLYTPYHASFRDFLTGNVDIAQLRPRESYLVQELAEQSKEAHKRIVNVFRTECDENWAVLVEQDYPRLYLTGHLAHAADLKTLLKMLTEGNEHIAWAEARYKKEETYAGFVNDLAYVWKFAQERKIFALLIRCMLIETSIRSLAKNIPPILLSELAKTGFWSYPRCLTTIRQIPDSTQQAKALAQLAPSVPKTLLEETLSLAREIKNEYSRVRAFAALAPHLNEELKTKLLTSIREINDEYFRAYAFAALAPHLNEELKRKLLTAIREINDESVRARAFAELAPHLSDELKTQVISEALTTARAIKDETDRVLALSELAPHLNDDLRMQLLAATRAINDENSRSYAFSVLAPHLNDELKMQALAAARAINDESARALALSRLASHLNDELKTQLLAEALSATRAINDKNSRLHAFAELAPQLNEELKTQVLAEVLTTQEYARSYAFSELVPHLNDELKIQALAAAYEIKAESNRARVLSALAPYLNDELRMQLLAAARELKTESARANVFAELAPHLNDELKAQVISEALTATRAIKDDYARARVFATLAPHFNDELKTKLIASVREINDESARTYAFAELTPHLNDELKRLLLTSIREIKNESVRASAFAEFAPYLNDELKTQVISEALTATRTIKDETDHGRAFSKLAPHLNEELKMQALAAARAIKNESVRVHAFAELAPHLNDELITQVLAEALTSVRAMHDEFSRAYAFSELAPHLNDELKMQAVATARTIKDEYSRVRAFSELAPHLNDELKTQVLAEALTATRAIKDKIFIPSPFSYLASLLNEELQMQALAAARAIKDESNRALAFSELAPHLNDELKVKVVSEALAAAREIQDEAIRARAFAALAPFFENKIKVDLLTNALLGSQQGFEIEKVLAEWKVIHYEDLQEPVIELLRIISINDRGNGLSFLNALIPSLVYFEGEKIGGEILRAIRDTARWWP